MKFTEEKVTIIRNFFRFGIVLLTINDCKYTIIVGNLRLLKMYIIFIRYGNKMGIIPSIV